MKIMLVLIACAARLNCLEELTPGLTLLGADDSLKASLADEESPKQGQTWY